MNQLDMAKLADRVRRLADLLETRGTKALATAHTWIDTSGQYRPPGDPSEGPGRDKLDRLDPMRHKRLTANLGRLDVDVATLTGLILDTVPREPDAPREDECPEDVCQNCWTDNRHCEPVSHYARLCRWCGDFRGEMGRLPPRALLRLRHAGRKVTTVDVERALGRSA